MAVSETSMQIYLDRELSFFSSERESVREAAAYLSVLGCCPYCVLRCLGATDAYNYVKALEHLQSWIASCLADYPQKSDQNGSASSVTDDNQQAVCVLCLGLLQTKYCSDTFTNHVVDAVKASGYEYDDFALAVSMPVCILLREYSMWCVLRERYPKMYYGLGTDDMLASKEVWKFLNGPAMAKKLGIDEEKRSMFEIALNFLHENDERECSFLLDLFPNRFIKRKNNTHGQDVFTRTNVLKALGDISVDKFKKNYCCPPRQLNSQLECQPVSSCHDAIFLAGRYIKKCRTLPQTPWIIEGERKGESSIEEIICNPIKNIVKSLETRFSAAGREDIDVLCLGNGRPFLVECMDPHVIRVSKEQVQLLQQVINGSTDKLAVKDLQVVDRDSAGFLKEGEMEKTKSYSALCWSPQLLTQDLLDKLNSIKNLSLSQKTPIRVLHRRCLATRPKVIHTLSASAKDSHHFTLHLSTQAGTYIKEFVHGDFGRTRPNLGSILGIDCDILQLDVESVDVDWPPTVQLS